LFRSWTEFCLAKRPYGLERSALDIAALVQEAKDPKAAAEKAKPLAEHRRPTKEEEDKGNDVTFMGPKKGNSSSYLTVFGLPLVPPAKRTR
jgi:hypothetical protein